LAGLVDFRGLLFGISHIYFLNHETT